MREAISELSNNLDFWEGENHSSSASQKILFTAHDSIFEMPRQHKVIVRIQRFRVGLRNNGNMASGSYTTKFIRIDVCDRRDVRRRKLTELEYDVSFGGGPIAENCFAVSG